MRHDSSVILTRASGFGTLQALFSAAASEAALDHIFGAEDVPIQVLEMPATPVPVAAMQRIFDRCARYLDDRTFGLTVGKTMQHHAYGNYALYGLNAPTLGHALRRLVRSAWAQHTGRVKELVPQGQHVMWRYLPPEPGRLSRAHAEHIIWPMIHFVRAFLGPGWHPSWVEVIGPPNTSSKTLEDVLGLPVLCNHRAAGIAIPMASLDEPLNPLVPRPSRVTLRELVADTVMKDAAEPARSISAIVAMRLLDGKTDIDGAAMHAGLGVQGLQRRLRQKGYTYREVVEHARHARAIHLLQESTLPIAAVAHELGYQEHTSFTRAFIRWEGCAPSVFARESAQVRRAG